ncbi:MAG: hypothetical protein Q8S84_01635 [bacterium]|nr:hypothetical protein [bacterium]
MISDAHDTFKSLIAITVSQLFNILPLQSFTSIDELSSSSFNQLISLAFFAIFFKLINYFFFSFTFISPFYKGGTRRGREVWSV